MNESFTLFQYWVMTVSGVSLCISFTALIVSWITARRANGVVLRLLDVRGYTRSDAEAPLGAHWCAVRIQNLGIPLDDVAVRLRFDPSDGSGSTKLQMRPYSMATGEPLRGQTELKRGTVAMFQAGSQSINEYVAQRLGVPVRHHVFIDVDTAGHEARSFRIRDLSQPARWWNRVAFTVNWRRNKTITTHDGTPRLKLGHLLPLVRDPATQVKYFVEHALAAHSKHGPDSSPPS